ncbi:MAG: hypothetical protein AAF555_03265 [Verrucomicrobiota bacterium]
MTDDPTAPAPEELRPLVLPEPPPDYTALWLGSGIALALLCLAALAWQIHRLRQSLPTPTPASQAKAAFGLLTAEAEGLSSLEVARQASWIVRRFLSQQYQDPAFFESPHEFVERARTSPSLPESLREPWATWMKQCSQLRYRPQSPKEAQALLDAAESLLQAEP